MATTIQTIQKPTKARALDTSGNNNHGQIYSGRALEFDGVSDYLTSNNMDMSGGDTLTICTWVYSNTTGSGDEAIVNQEGNFRLIRTAANELTFTVATSNNAWYNVTIASSDLQDNSWNRIIALYDGSNMKIYINGTLSVTSSSITGNILNTSAKTFDIGRTTLTSNLWNGNLCDLQLWNAAFTAEDVTYDYLNPEQLALNRGGTSLTNSNLKAWYPMNDGHRGQQSYILDASNTGLGDNVIVNGNFDTDSDWTKGSGWSISDGKAIFSGSAFASLTPSSAPLISGKVYKITFDATVTNGSFKLQHNSVDIITESTSGSYTAYITSTATTFNIARASVGVQNDFTIDNIVIKPVNYKNHATTVFYGDEKVANGDMNVTDPATVTIGGVAATVHDATFDDSTSITDHTDTDTNNKTIKVTGDSSSQYPLIRWSDGSNMGLVTGRTYYVEVWVYIPSSNSLIDKVQLKVMDNAASTELLSNVTTTTDTWTKLSGTFVDDDIARIDIVGIDTDGSSGGAQDFSSEVFYIDDLSVKEVGTASGWTDADQQLNIPQTALQSYNQLAWFPGQEGSDVTLDTTIDTLATAWSFSFWLFNMESGNSFDFIIGAGSNRNLAVDNNSNRKLYYRDGDGVYNALSDEVIPEGKWLHIVVTAIADTSITAYINGEAQTTSTTMAYGGSDPDTQLIVDRFMEGYSAGNYESRGSITEISYFANTTLNQAQVNTLYNDGKAYDVEKDTTLWSACTAYWRNNGLAEWQDRKGTNDLNTNGVTETMLITAGVDGSRDSQGFIMNRQRATNSLNFNTNTLADGLEDNAEHVNVLGRIDLGTSDFSISFWVYKFNDWTDQIICSQYEDNNNRWYIRGSGATAKVMIYAASGGNSVLYDSDSTSLDNSTYLENWVHIVCAVDRSAEIKWYINGANTSTGTVDGSGDEVSGQEGTSLTTSADFQIGRDANTAFDDHHFDGQIDDLLIYSKYLSAAEVKRIYNAGKRSHR
jgi:hypothetical protein